MPTSLKPFSMGTSFFKTSFFALETSATLPTTMPIYYICIILLFSPCPLTLYKNKARLPTYLPKNSCIRSFTFIKLMSRTADDTSLREWSTGSQDGVRRMAAQKRPAEPSSLIERKVISRLAKVQASRRSAPCATRKVSSPKWPTLQYFCWHWHLPLVSSSVRTVVLLR